MSLIWICSQLGIAADLKGKSRLLANSHAVLEAVAKGTSDIGIGLTSDTAVVSGVDFVGALPAEIQSFTAYSAAVVTTSKQVDAAKAFVSSLSSSGAKSALKAKGFEPR